MHKLFVIFIALQSTGLKILGELKQLKNIFQQKKVFVCAFIMGLLKLKVVLILITGKIRRTADTSRMEECTESGSKIP